MSSAALRLERLLERSAPPAFELPSRLAEAYGGQLGISRPSVYANFVASVDGVVAVPGDQESGKIISQASRADRFVMGLLRAFADAVLIGADTFRKTPRTLWDSPTICPDFAAEFAQVRARLQLPPRPQLVIVSGSGRLEAGPALEDATVITTRAGEASLRRLLPGSARLAVLEGERVSSADVMRVVREAKFERLLCEGGPSLFGELVSAGCIDELFLTVSPQLFGRSAGDGKKALLEGVDLGGIPLELQSLRRDASHLFLRYSIGERRVLTVDA